MLLAATTRRAIPRKVFISDSAWAPELRIRSTTTSALGQKNRQLAAVAQDFFGGRFRVSAAPVEDEDRMAGPTKLADEVTTYKSGPADHENPNANRLRRVKSQKTEKTGARSAP